MTQRATPPVNQAQAVAERYSAGAEDYVRHWSPVIRPMGERLVEALPLATAQHILDIGCGAGALLPAIRARAPRAALVGVDRAVGMVRIAQAQQIAPLAVMDAQQLAIRPASIDLALMAFMLFHLPDPAQGLHEAARVLRPGGTLGLITWAHDPDFPASDVWEEELVRHGAQPEETPVVDQDALLDMPEKLAALLEQAGFNATRAWVERFEHQWDPERFIAYRIGHGSCRRRLETLTPDTRATCVERARARLATLTADAFSYQPELVFAIARR